MTITYFGPIIAALLAGTAIYYLFITLSESDKLTAQKLRDSESPKAKL